MDLSFNWYQQQLRYISTALFCSGILYLLAANWFSFPALIQLLIPQVLLITSCFAASYFSPHTNFGHCASITACVMIGLCFASYGQVYQTGADSFQLFAIWSILLLPWLYFRLNSVYVLLFITSLLALFLAQQQSLNLNEDKFYLLLMFFIFCFMLCADFFFRKTRIILLLMATIISLWLGFINYINNHNESGYNLLLPLVLPILLCLFYYHRKWKIGLAINALSISIVTTWIILDKIFNNTGYRFEIGHLLIIAVVVFAWCWVIAKVLSHFLPNNPYLSALPIAFGAWVSSLFLTGFIVALVALSAQSYDAIMVSVAILGLIMIALSLANYKASSHSIFLRNGVYALLLCGQLAFMIGAGGRLIELIYQGSFVQTLSLILFLIQTLFLIVSSYVIQNQFWRTLQASLLLILFFWITPYQSHWLLVAMFTLYYFKADCLIKNNWNFVWFITICLMIFLRLVLLESSWLYYSIRFFSPPSLGFDSIINLTLWQYNFLIIGFPLMILFLQRKKLKKELETIIRLNLKTNPAAKFRLANLTLIAFAITIVFLGYFNLLNILVLLALLLLISASKERLIHGIIMLTLAFSLWARYYNLNTPLLIKGLMIIGGGLLIALLSFTLPKLAKTAPKEMI